MAKLDQAGPRTWLLAALAGWGVLVWLLALLGMGGRVEPLADDPALRPALPQPRPAAANPRAAPARFDAVAARPLFSADRRPKPFTIAQAGEGEPQAAFDYQLTSTLITPSLRMAILQTPDGSQSIGVKIGEAPEAHPAWRLSGVEARSATFEGPEGARTLELRAFDGQGGQPPTPVAARPAGNVEPPVLPPPPAAPGTPQGTGAARPVATGTPVPSAPTPSPDALTPESQMEAIRQRIEARRAALRQQQQQRNAAPQPSPPNP